MSGMQILLGKVRRMLLENLGLKLFSLALAAVVFIYAVSQGEMDSHLSRPVELVLTKPNGVVNTSSVPKEIRVDLAGPWAAVKGLGELPPVRIDLGSFPMGPTTYYLNDNLLSLPPGLKVVSMNPAFINIHLEPEVERTVPLTVNLRGEPAYGYRIERYQLSPKEVTIIGAKSSVARTDYLEIEPVDIAGRSASFEREVQPLFLVGHARLKEKTTLRLHVEIAEEQIERTFSEVGVVVKNTRYSARVQPEKMQVTVKGPRRAIDQIDSQSLRIVIDAARGEHTGAGVFSDSGRVEGLPAGVRVVGELPAVQIRLSGRPRP